MIRLVPRFSNTEESDDEGRWMRIAVLNNLQIAWISRTVTPEKMEYTLTCNFPCVEFKDLQPQKHVTETFEEATALLGDEWAQFLQKIINMTA